MEAARRMDEFKVLSKKIPSFSMIPEFKPQPLSSKAHIHLNTGEWLILSKVNGIKSIEEISSETNLTIFDLCKILYGLITNNLIQLKQPPSSEAPQPIKAESTHKEEPTSTHEQEKIEKKHGKDALLTPEHLEEASFHEIEAPEVAGQAFSKPENAKLLLLLNRIKEIAEQILGNQGKAIISKEYEIAKGEIEKGKSMEALNNAITQIARATTILKGPSTTEMFLEQIKLLKST